MSNKVIGDYSAAVSIDGSTHYLLVQPGDASTAYNKITRNVFLGVTGQPVDISTVQTLSNKVIGNTNTVTVKGTLFTIQDDGDTTKQARFQLSGITTATTRTYTLPNASSTLADISTAQTLTNKTLTAPVITNGSITGTTITTDAIIGQSASTSGTVYGLPIASSKVGTNGVVTASITDAAVTPAKLIAGTGSSWAWQSWTPTFTNLSGGTLVFAKYIQTGKTVRFRLRYTMTGANVSGLPRFTLPVTMNSDYVANFAPDFGGQLNDASSNRWVPRVLLASTTACDIYYLNSSVNTSAVDATTPFTWAVNDQIDISGAYEAA